MLRTSEKIIRTSEINDDSKVSIEEAELFYTSKVAFLKFMIFPNLYPDVNEMMRQYLSRQVFHVCEKTTY